MTLQRPGSRTAIAAVAMILVVGGSACSDSPAGPAVPGPVSTKLSTMTTTDDTILASSGNHVSTFTVRARDTTGKVIAGATVVLNVTGSGNAVGQPLGTTNDSGVVTGTLSATVAALKVVSATINGVAISATDTVVVLPGAATQLAFTQQPEASTGTNATFSATVAAEDAFGNVDPTFTGTVTLSLGGGSLGAQLSGTLSQAAVAGVVSYTDLRVNQVGTAFQLVASHTGFSVIITSTPFDIIT